MVLRPVRQGKKKHRAPMSPLSTCIFLLMLKHWKSHRMINVCLKSLRSGWWQRCCSVMRSCPKLYSRLSPALVSSGSGPFEGFLFFYFFMNEAKVCWLSHMSLAVPCTNGTIQHGLKYAARNTSGPDGGGGHTSQQTGRAYLWRHRRCFQVCFLIVVMCIMH